MNVWIALIIYLLLFVGGMMLSTRARHWIFHFPFVGTIVNPGLYYFFVIYYLIFFIYFLSLFIRVTGTPSQLLIYGYVKLILGILLGGLSIVYGILWLITIIESPIKL